MRRTTLQLLLALVLVANSPPRATAAEPDAPKAPARAPVDSLFDDEVLAKGQGVKVTSSQLDTAYLALRANLASRNEDIPAGERTFREAQLLDRLIITQVLTNRATAADLTNANALEQRFLADSMKTSTSEEAFNRQLRAMSLTPAQFRQRVRDQAVSEAVIDREVKASLPVSDADIEELYRTGTDYRIKALLADLARFAAEPASKPAEIAIARERIDAARRQTLGQLEQPERVRVLHMFLGTRERAAEKELPAEQKSHKRDQLVKLRTRALAGEDFAKLVIEFSEDRGLAQTKGEYTFSRQDPFAPEFKAAAFSLEPGKFSDVISTPYGFHLIKLLEKLPPQKTELDKVSKELREILQQQSLQKALPDYFARLKKEAAIEILEPKYRIDLKNATPLK